MMKQTTRGGRTLPCRRAVCFALAGAFTRVIAEEFTVIYGEESWYRERNEPEQEWRGSLQRRTPDRGPGSRASLRFTLRMSERSIPVYAPEAVRKLAAFAGQRVVVRGKLIDLRNEGFGEELWIGSIRAEK